MTRISSANCVTDLLYTSLESPNKQLHGDVIKKGVASCTGPSRPLEWNSIFFIQQGVAALFEEPRPKSLELLKAGY